MATVLTKGEIVLFALRKFAIASNTSLTDVEPQSIEDGVNDLEDMMSEWMINPGDIGYAFATGDEQP
ncbi:packaged DNA stabilization protein p27, partial [Escherichia coli]|nr:packaged DNA stabilization protein p27 [Escherichia coli]